MLEGFLPTPILVLVAFERWNDILKLPAPASSLLITTAVWRFARGVAHAKLGKPDLAAREQSAWQGVVAKIPPDTMYDELNKTGAVFKIHEHLLSAAVTGSRRDDKVAIEFLKQAVTAEDALNYSEPPPWYPPVRPTLGRILLEAKQLEQAENVFRADLERNPRNGRALAGLRDCLNAQGRKYDAEKVDQQFREAWKPAATKKKVASQP